MIPKRRNCVTGLVRVIFCHHRLRGSSSTVVTMTSKVNGKMKIWTTCRSVKFIARWYWIQRATSLVIVYKTECTNIEMTGDYGIYSVPLGHCNSIGLGKISVSELHFFLNIRTVLHKIIINKRIITLSVTGKVVLITVTTWHVLFSFAKRERQPIQPVKFRYGTFS